jgi:hypothetical protein
MASVINATTTGLKGSEDTSGVLQLQTNSTPALTLNLDGTHTIHGTGAITVPVGTTAQRPSSPTVGSMRYNTTTSNLEVYISGAWLTLP